MILFRSRDACSDSAAELSFVLDFITIIGQYVVKWGIAQVCLCKTECQGGGSAPFWESANLHEEASHDMGYRYNSITVSLDMGPLSA